MALVESIKLIVFDLDGTLVDSKQLYVNTIHKKLKDNGFLFTKREIEKGLGPKLKKSLENVFQNHHTKHNSYIIKKLTKEINDSVSKQTSKLKLCKDVKKVLKKLKDMGIILVLLTNSAAKYTKLLLKEKKMIQLFDKIFCAEDFDRKEIVIKNLRKSYHLKNNEILYVADKLIDIAIAKKANCRICIVLRCSWDKELFKEKFKDKKGVFIIKDLNYLIK